jgi:hypothetical protein
MALPYNPGASTDMGNPPLGVVHSSRAGRLVAMLGPGLMAHGALPLGFSRTRTLPRPPTSVFRFPAWLQWEMKLAY